MFREESLQEEGLYTADFNSKQLDSTSTSPKLTPSEIQKMIMDNRESARKIAHSLLRRWRVALPTEEIESLVDLTLCEAANRYCPNQGASFMTFFFYYVRGNLARNIGKLARISRFFVSTGSSLESVAFTGNTSNNTGDAGSSADQWSAFSQDNNAPEQLLLSRERVSLCNRALDALDAVDREVLLRLYDGEESLVDIAKTLGYSRCHISRIKKRALKQFQTSLAEVSDVLPQSGSAREASELNSHKRRGRHRREISSSLVLRKKLVNSRQCA